MNRPTPIDCPCGERAECVSLKAEWSSEGCITNHEYWCDSCWRRGLTADGETRWDFPFGRQIITGMKGESR